MMIGLAVLVVPFLFTLAFLMVWWITDDQRWCPVVKAGNIANSVAVTIFALTQGYWLLATVCAGWTVFIFLTNTDRDQRKRLRRRASSAIKRVGAKLAVVAIPSPSPA